MKVEINQDGCTECGGCEEACSEVFVVESGEKAKIVEKYQTDGSDKGEVGEELSDCVKEAEDVCPVDVITTS